MRKLGWTVLVLVTLAGAGIWWLFYANGSPGKPFAIRMDAIRAQSAAEQGAGPQRIEVETISHQLVPKIAMVAGSSWGKVDLVRASYRLVYPGFSVVIDTTYDRATATDADRFDDAAFARVHRALGQARTIVVTHEHGDHLGGLKTAPDLARLMPHAVLTAEQMTSRAGAEPRWRGGFRGFVPLVYSELHAVAPGVMLIKAPGHTPGSQMVYVHRADGREFLFMGDVASMLDNVTTGHIRSHLVTDWYTHEERAPVLAQVSAIRALKQANPALVLVPGHDGAAIVALQRAGLLVPGFRL